MILLIGKNSTLAREFISSLADTPYRVVSHSQVDDPNIYANINLIINFAFAPGFYDTPYLESSDIDLRIARHASYLGIHYVMLSSRKVYQSSIRWNAREDLVATGSDTYGRNKLRIESELAKMLPKSLTILRPGNVLGYELRRNRMSFGSYLLQQLATTGRIRLTINPKVRRNILSIDSFCQILAAVAALRPSGIYNVGSTEPVEVGQVASWIIDGFGSGRLISEGDQFDDEFHLNVDRLTSVIGLKYDASALENYAKSLGRRLKTDSQRVKV